MNDDQPSNEQVAHLLEYFVERLNRVFGYFFCVLEFENDQDKDENPSDNDRAWSLQTIHNACMHSTLISIRDIDDVLSPRSSSNRSDDFRVSDIGFPNSTRFLAASERDQINKLIAHSTYKGAGSAKVYWDIWDLSSRAVCQSLVIWNGSKTITESRILKL